MINRLPKKWIHSSYHAAHIHLPPKSMLHAMEFGAETPHLHNFWTPNTNHMTTSQPARFLGRQSNEALLVKKEKPSST